MLEARDDAIEYLEEHFSAVSILPEITEGTLLEICLSPFILSFSL